LHQAVYRGAVAEIDLNAVSRNFRTVKRLTGNRPVIAVVKADAYGHGAAEVAKKLADEGATFFAVAFTEEAVRLREAGNRSRILVLFDKFDAPVFLEYHLTPVLYDLPTARMFSREARKRNRFLDVHVKIYTGMGRLGFNSRDVMKEVAAIGKMPNLRITGLMSHFSDSDISDTSYAEKQLKSFHAVRESLRKKSGGPLLCHMANSAAVLSLKEAHLDAVRPGLILYGHSPFQRPSASGGSSRKSEVGRNTNPQAPSVRLVPAMKVKTEILSLRRLRKGTPVSYGRTFITGRDSVIAVLPVGYADGYNRALTNTMEVLVKGKRAPVAGRVCMDLIMVDVTGIQGVKERDEVVLLGRQGREEITASEMGTKAGTISYEILTSLGSRSRRIYV
jgi:alanine racemase